MAAAMPVKLWRSDEICLRRLRVDATALAADVYRLVCRTDFHAPGFCAVSVGDQIGSVEFRELMVQLKRELAALHRKQNGDSLVYASAARFDQQESTKLHLDSGPDESFLMLGYEPSEVDSQLAIADYAQCAWDMGLSPKDFLARHNPIFRAGEDLLRPYTTTIPCFSRRDYQIVCINNSSAPFTASGTTWQGTLHAAKILTPDETKCRVINSTMVVRAPLGTPDKMNATELAEFTSTTKVHRHGYDKPHLAETE
jgi:hypothetical protein